MNIRATLQILSSLVFSCLICACQPDKKNDPLHAPDNPEVTEVEALRIGTEVLLAEELDQLTDKRVAIVANHTSLLPGGAHLVDTLLGAGVAVTKVFAPEHGFRGNADAGANIEDGVDTKTGLPLLSLHGKNRKPSAAHLAEIDLVIFDIQDVGTRFYTYISTMTYVMEACAELGVDFMVLDRPNPNGWYVEGPVLESEHSSFIGMHEIPIVHGMSVAEYARMVKGEKWINAADSLNLTVIPCQGYTHEMRWEETGLEWIAPSPNLATEYAAYLYAAICWLEPTPASVGRGTDSAFTMVGAPWFVPEIDSAWAQLGAKAFTFTPRSLPGKSTYPKFQDKACEGFIFSERVDGKALMLAGIELFQAFYAQAPDKGKFFGNSFARWPGTAEFRQQIVAGQSAEEIWESWQADLGQFKVVRNRYLIYP